MIKATNLVKSFGDLTVLNNVNLEIKKGEVVSIVGASGAGKTTLLQILGSLEKPLSGKVEIDGVEISSLKGKQLAEYRNKHIGFVFQFHHLLPEFTALENVCIPGYIAGRNKSEVKKKAIELLNSLGLKDRVDHKPSELSGGEQQRVAVARALINNPKVVFADEPSGNLDSHKAQELHQLFFDLNKKYNQTFVIITHNNELADLANRKLTMEDGQIIH